MIDEALETWMDRKVKSTRERVVYPIATLPLARIGYPQNIGRITTNNIIKLRNYYIENDRYGTTFCVLEIEAMRRHFLYNGAETKFGSLYLRYPLVITTSFTDVGPIYSSEPFEVASISIPEDIEQA